MMARAPGLVMAACLIGLAIAGGLYVASYMPAGWPYALGAMIALRERRT